VGRYPRPTAGEDWVLISILSVLSRQRPVPVQLAPDEVERPTADRKPREAVKVLDDVRPAEKRRVIEPEQEVREFSRYSAPAWREEEECELD
jgi:hypothetical protein